MKTEGYLIFVNGEMSSPNIFATIEEAKSFVEQEKDELQYSDGDKVTIHFLGAASLQTIVTSTKWEVLEDREAETPAPKKVKKSHKVSSNGKRPFSRIHLKKYKAIVKDLKKGLNCSKVAASHGSTWTTVAAIADHIGIDR